MLAPSQLASCVSLPSPPCCSGLWRTGHCPRLSASSLSPGARPCSPRRDRRRYSRPSGPSRLGCGLCPHLDRVMLHASCPGGRGYGLCPDRGFHRPQPSGLSSLGHGFLPDLDGVMPQPSGLGSPGCGPCPHLDYLMLPCQPRLYSRLGLTPRPHRAPGPAQRSAVRSAQASTRTRPTGQRVAGTAQVGLIACTR